MAERDPESGAAHGHDRHRQLDAKPYASGCAECKQLLLDQLSSRRFFVSLRPPATNTSTFFST
jgi:hypothetical protein